MNLKDKKYVIVEIIPTTSKKETGMFAQISALKIDGLKLIDRFDYRINKNKIDNIDILNMTNYDNDKFNYVNSNKIMISKFKKFIEKMPLLIIDNSYTNSYLSYFDNEKYSVFDLLNIKVSDDSFDELIKKYNLEPSNYLVDLLYEAIIKEI